MIINMVILFISGLLLPKIGPVRIYKLYVLLHIGLVLVFLRNPYITFGTIEIFVQFFIFSVAKETWLAFENNYSLYLDP